MVRENIYSAGMLDLSPQDGEEAVTGQYLTLGRDGPFIYYDNSIPGYTKQTRYGVSEIRVYETRNLLEYFAGQVSITENTTEGQ